MKNRGTRIARNAVDILIFVQTHKFLLEDLMMKGNVTKTNLTDLDQGITYLGYALRAFGVTISELSIRKF
jgi:hypothetical protein